MTPFLALFSFYDGMSSGLEPVITPPRYGPALSEKDRLRWFSDDRTPFQRYSDGKKREREQRMSLGIIPDERPISKRAISKKPKDQFWEETEESTRPDVETEEFISFIKNLGD